MKKGLILMAVFACTLVMHAQEKVKFSIIAGTNLSTFTGDVENVDPILGFSLGAGLNYDLSEKWALRPSLYFVTKGSKAEGMIDRYFATEKARPLYLEMPVDICYRMPLNEKLNFNILAGAYLSYGLSGKIEAEIDKGVSTVTEKWDFFGASRAKRLDAGLEIGAGLEVDRLTFSLKAQFGLVSMSRAAASVKNQTFALGVAYTL